MRGASSMIEQTGARRQQHDTEIQRAVEPSSPAGGRGRAPLMLSATGSSHRLVAIVIIALGSLLASYGGPLLNSRRLTDD